MKIITIQQTKNGGGYVASVNGMKNYQAIASNEMDALGHLVEMLYGMDKEWIKWPREGITGAQDIFMESTSLNGSDCMHDNCPRCRNGTCSGVHMISCPCKKCNPYS